MKVLIIGTVANGKTTLAKRLSKELNIEHYEIDSIVHDDKNKIKRNNNEQRAIINHINRKENWIIEGVLRKNLYNLLDLADIICYINIPLKIRKRRIFKRFIKQKLHIEKCNYKPTLKMLKDMYKWTNDFEQSKESFEETMLQYKEKLVILNTEKDVVEYTLKK